MRLLRDAVEDLIGSDLSRMAPDGVRASVVALEQAERRLAAERLRRIAWLEARVERERGVRAARAETKDLLASLGRDDAAATSEAKLARGFVPAVADAGAGTDAGSEDPAASPDAVAGALTAGEITTAHAMAVRRVLDRLTREGVDAEVRAAAKAELLDVARGGTPAEVRACGQRLRHRHDPEVLDRDHQRAHRLRYLHLDDQPGDDGLVGIHGRVTPDEGDVIRTVLDANAKPDALSLPPEQRRSRGQRLADALSAICSHAASCTNEVLAPPATIIVTGTAQAFAGLADTDPAELGALAPVATKLAEAVACDARWTPLVTRWDGRPLAVLDPIRTFTARQRAALIALDRGCRLCNAPPSACHAHHVHHHEDGGPTMVANGILLCRRHHTRWHQQRWKGELSDDRTLTITRPHGTTTRHPPPTRRGHAEVA